MSESSCCQEGSDGPCGPFDDLQDERDEAIARAKKAEAQNAKLKEALLSIMMANDLGFSERLRLARKARAVLAECKGTSHDA